MWGRALMMYVCSLDTVAKHYQTESRLPLKVQNPGQKMVPWVVCFQGRLNLGIANTQTKNIPEY